MPESERPSVRKALRQARDQDNSKNAERLLRNLARRLEREVPGVSNSILDGLDEMLTVRLGLPRWNCADRWRPTRNRRIWLWMSKLKL